MSPPPSLPPRPDEQQQWTTRPYTSGFAVAALIFGIVGLIGLPLVGAILALACGYKGRNDIDRSHGRLTGRGMAVAGVVMGYVGLFTGVLYVVYVILYNIRKNA